jgi:hypothetical protein
MVSEIFCYETDEIRGSDFRFNPDQSSISTLAHHKNVNFNSGQIIMLAQTICSAMFFFSQFNRLRIL